MKDSYDDAEEAWFKIENDIQDKPKKNEPKVELDPYQKKYKELSEKYGKEYPNGAVTFDVDCERLLDNLWAFERVFSVMKDK